MSLISATKTVGKGEESSILTPTTGDFSLYIHVPFCLKKCPYCHFFVLLDQESAQKKFLSGWHLEWKQILAKINQEQATNGNANRLISIYFGGGTPALLGPLRIQEILDQIFEAFAFHSSIEITLEANPETLTACQIKEFAKAGVNRISIGVQTFDDHLLKKIGRTHDAKRAKEAVLFAEKGGISNISIDLMYDLPGQTLESWDTSLQVAITLPLQHLSLYNLTIEPGTVFARKKTALQKELPSESQSLAMYQRAREVLEKGGLHQYEISAFARDHRCSKHNVGYWTGRPFLGMGPSAFSFWKGMRFQNVCHLEGYLTSLEKGIEPIGFRDEISLELRLKELFAIAIRLFCGVNLLEFQKKFGKLPQELLESLPKLEEKGWIISKNQTLFLTEKGVLFYDTLASEMI